MPPSSCSIPLLSGFPDAPLWLSGCPSLAFRMPALSRGSIRRHALACLSTMLVTSDLAVYISDSKAVSVKPPLSTPAASLPSAALSPLLLLLANLILMLASMPRWNRGTGRAMGRGPSPTVWGMRPNFVLQGRSGPERPSVPGQGRCFKAQCSFWAENEH